MAQPRSEHVTVDGCGPRGFDGHDGNNGTASSMAGGTGNKGENATAASNGGSGLIVNIQVAGEEPSLDGSKLATLYVRKESEGSGVAEESQIQVGRNSTVSVAVNGGSGGHGGVGGNGGPGRKGKRGHDATRIHNGGNGGPGGDGGEGGIGSRGANGGPGGSIRIHVLEDQTHLLMMFKELSVSGGKGGNAGRHGSGGPGGPGGSGGRSKTYHTGSGDNRRTHHRPGGRRGQSGRSGRTYNFELQDGEHGPDGKIEIVVRRPDGSSITYPGIYDLRLVKFDLTEVDRQDSIFEFGELIKCGNIVLTNVGGMPSPNNHPIFIRLNRFLRWFACPDGGHHYQGLVAEPVDDENSPEVAQVEQDSLDSTDQDEWVSDSDDDVAVAKMVGSPSFFVSVAQVRPGDTLVFREDQRLWILARQPDIQTVLDALDPIRISAKVVLECGMVGINRTFPSFHCGVREQYDTITLQYPVMLLGCSSLHSLGRDEASKLDIKIRNVSPTCNTADRRVLVRARAVQTHDGDISKSEWIEGHEMLRITFDRARVCPELMSLAQGEGPVQELGTIQSDRFVTVYGGLKMGSNVPALSRFEIRITLEINNIETPVTGAQQQDAELDMRVAQVVRFPINLGQKYTHTNNSLALLVVNRNLAESNQVAWQEAFKSLGMVGPDVWDSDYIGAPADWHASAEPLVNYRNGTVVMFYEDLFVRRDLMDALHNANIDLIIVKNDPNDVLCRATTPFFTPALGNSNREIVTIDIQTLRAMDPEALNKLWDFRINAGIKAVRKAFRKCQLPYWQGVAEVEDQRVVRIRRLPDFDRGRLVVIRHYKDRGVTEDCFRAICDGITFSVRLELLVDIEKRGNRTSENSGYIEDSLLADICAEFDRWYERFPEGLSSKEIFQGMLFWSSAVAMQSKFQSARLAALLNKAFYYVQVLCGRRLAVFGFRGLLGGRRPKLKHAIKKYGMGKMLSKPSLAAAKNYFASSTRVSWFAKKKAAAMRRQMSPHVFSDAVRSSSRVESLRILDFDELRAAGLQDSNRVRTINDINTMHACNVSDMMLSTL